MGTGVPRAATRNEERNPFSVLPPDSLGSYGVLGLERAELGRLAVGSNLCTADVATKSDQAECEAWESQGPPVLGVLLSRIGAC